MAPVNGELHAVGGGKVDFILIFLIIKAVKSPHLWKIFLQNIFLP